jgi:hypothetical protein
MTGQREQKESQTTSEMGNPCTNCMANPHTRNNMQLDFMGTDGHAILNWIM